MDIEVTIITSIISTNMRDVFIPLPSRRWRLQYVSFSSRIIFYPCGFSRTSSESRIRTLLKYDSCPANVEKTRHALTEGVGGGFVPVLDLLLQALSSLRDVPRPFAGFASPSGLLRVQGFAFASVAQVEVILVKRELIVLQNPTLPTRAVEGLRPTSRSYNLVWSLLRRDVGERPTYVQNFWVGAVASDGSAVDPAYIGGSAVVVRVGQTAGFAVAFGDERTVLHARQEVVALLKGIDADPVFLRHGLEGGYQALVYGSVSQVSYGPLRGLKVAGLQELPRPAARAFGGPFASRHARSQSESSNITEEDQEHQAAKQSGDDHNRNQPPEARSLFGADHRSTFSWLDGTTLGRACVQTSKGGRGSFPGAAEGGISRRRALVLMSGFYDVALLLVSARKRMHDSSSALAPSRKRPERR